MAQALMESGTFSSRAEEGQAAVQAALVLLQALAEESSDSRVRLLTFARRMNEQGYTTQGTVTLVNKLIDAGSVELTNKYSLVLV